MRSRSIDDAMRRAALPTTATIMIVAGVFALGAIGNQDLAEPPAPATTDSSSTAASVPATTGTSEGSGQSGPFVTLLDGATDLQSSIVLTTFPSANTPRTIWNIEAGQLTSRTEVPLAPGDWPHLLIAGGNHIAFTAPPGASLLHSDFGAAAVPVHPARYLVPGKTPAAVWAVNDRITQVTAIDMINGTAEQTIDLPASVNWVMGVVADGFVVLVGDSGEASYWQPGEDPAAIALPDPAQSGVVAMSGNNVAIVSPGGIVSLLDVKTGQRTDVEIDIGDGFASAVCISPNQQFALVVGSTGTAIVVDFRIASAVSSFTTTQEFHGVAWTGDSQFVHADGDRLIASEATDAAAREVARLSGTNWSIASSAATC